MVSEARAAATLSLILIALLWQASFAQETSTDLNESTSADICGGISTAILSSFANDEDRIAELLSLESDCAGTGIYEARLLQLYSEARRYEEGEILGERAIALDSAYEREILAALAHLALGRNDEEQAMIHVKELLERHPEWPYSLIYAARLVQAEYQWNAAIVLIEAANEIEETGDAHLILSGLHYSNGNHEQALLARKRALDLDPSGMRFTEFVVIAVMSLIELDRTDEARALLDQHVELVPQAQASPMTAFLEMELAGGLLDDIEPRTLTTSADQPSASPPQVDPNAQRSNEEINAEFERNKGAIFALYNRALRRDPELRGRVVFSLRIQPNGRVDECEVTESEINDQELLDRLCQRLLLFRFEELNVSESVTVSKPIDFIPN